MSFIDSILKSLGIRRRKRGGPVSAQPQASEYQDSTSSERRYNQVGEEPIVYNTALGNIPFYSIWITLTQRERVVARLVRQGLSNAEIAAKLQISEPTVKSHVHSILAKFHVRSRRALSDALHGLDLDAQ